MQIDELKETLLSQIDLRTKASARLTSFDRNVVALRRRSAVYSGSRSIVAAVYHSVLAEAEIHLQFFCQKRSLR